MTGPAYSNRLARYYCLAVSRVLGQSGLNAVLKLAGLAQYVDALPPDDLTRAFAFDNLAAMTGAVEQMYGLKARRLLHNIGAAWLRQGVQTFGALNGMSDPAFAALPAPERGQLALLALADVFTRFSDQTSRVSVTATGYDFVIDNSAFACGRGADRPVCGVMVGLLEETLPWATGGLNYPVRETTCRAMGAAMCTIEVLKQPVG